MNRSPALRGLLAKLAAGACTLSLISCTALGGSGPTSSDVRKADNRPLASSPIKIVELTPAVAARVNASMRTVNFSDTLGESMAVGTIVGRGDILDVAIWEAPPAALFGSSISDSKLSATATSVARSSSLPEQMVSNNGRISIPFAGEIMAAGRTPQQIERDIEARLKGKAHDPQVVVRLVRNTNSNVTVVGDVGSSARVPLTPKGERLLDILASAGGAKQAVGKTVIQITRRDRVVTMPLESVIKDPRQNVVMQPDDVVTALFQPYSFTSLGATGANAEINFEGTGISLSQALGRVGGLRDDRANVRGVFIFRFENSEALDPALRDGAATTPDGKVPVIYRVDLKDPATLFMAQNFPIKDKDILYVSNAPLADLQKFVGIVSQIAFSIISVGGAVN